MPQAKDNFTKRMFRMLWIPAMLSSFGWAMSDMADAIVVGQRLGPVGLAAISLILPVYMVNFIFAHGLGLGGSVRFSRLLGQGHREQAQDLFRAILALTLIFGITTAVIGSLFIQPLLALLGTRPQDGALYTATRNYLQVLLPATPLFYFSTVFNYFLRNDESYRRAGVGSVVGNLFDIGFNIFFVLVLNMGTQGAALSTAIGQIVSLAIYLPGFLDKDGTIRLGRPKLRGSLRPALSALRTGLATSVQYFYQMIFYLLCNNLLIRMGGEPAVAVFDLIQNTSYLLLYIFDGTGRAMQPILSTYEGEHNRQGKRNVARIGFTAGMLLGGAMVALVEIWPMGLCHLFGLAGSASEPLALWALRFYGIAALFAGTNILICSYYQSCENEKPSFILESLRGCIILIPITFLCASLDLRYFWLLNFLTEFCSLAVFLLLSMNGRFRKAELDEKRIYQRTILSTASDVVDVSQEVEAFCDEWGADMKQQMLVAMTIEEICVAILNHGFNGRQDGYIQITAVMEEDGTLELHLRDDATTFNPFDLHTREASADGDFDMDSMGVLMIRKRAKDFFYRRYQGFNTLIIKV